MGLLVGSFMLSLVASYRRTGCGLNLQLGVSGGRSTQLSTPAGPPQYFNTVNLGNLG